MRGDHDNCADAPTQDERLAELERRVAAIEELLSGPALPRMEQAHKERKERGKR